MMHFCLITFAMHKASFSSVLGVPAFRSISEKEFLTRRFGGFAMLPAELIRYGMA